MIILGQHVLAHHMLKDECDNHGAENDGTDSMNMNASVHHNEVNESANVNDGYDAKMPIASCNNECNAPSMNEKEEPVIGEGLININQWQDARLQVSMALGSIGAPALDIYLGSSSFSDNQSASSALNNDHHAQNNNLDIILDMTSTHVELLQTMNCTIQAMNIGASVQLGLVPININTHSSIGNGRVVARAEKAWIARRLKQHNNDQSKSLNDTCSMGNGHNYQPRLALQKLRNILHRTIADHASSLQSVLNSIQQIEEDGEYDSTRGEWGDFTNDLQHSTQQPTNMVLTISQLSGWVTHLGRFLSFVLSECLSRENLVRLLAGSSTSSVVRMNMMNSLQFARERMLFLHSACPLSCQSAPAYNSNLNTLGDDTNGITADNNRNVGDDSQCTNQRRQRQNAMKMIESIQATVEAARVSLWAFEQSYLDMGTDTNSDGCMSFDGVSRTESGAGENWWSQFKDMMERSYATIPEFEEQFLVPQIESSNEEALESNASELTQGENDVIVECSEHVSNATGTSRDGNLEETQDLGGLDSKHDDKTLVFSGSGIKRRTQRDTKQSAPKTSSSEPRSGILVPPPMSFSPADQMMLLRDLQQRIKTMGIAEEHEVVNMDKTCRDEVKRGQAKSAKNQKDNNRRENNKARPLFMGVSGSLLAELSSAMASNFLSDDSIPSQSDVIIE